MTPRLWAALIVLALAASVGGAGVWFLLASPRVDAAKAAEDSARKDLEAAQLRVSELELAIEIQTAASQIRDEEAAKAARERELILTRLNQIRSKIDVVAQEQGQVFVDCLGMPVDAFHDRLRSGSGEASAGSGDAGNRPPAADAPSATPAPDRPRLR